MKLKSNQSGQVVVEYILLLSVLVTVALAITSGLIGGGDEPGAVIKIWSGVLKTIAQDLPERPL